MIKLELEQTDDVLSTINKIKNISDLNIELVIPEESVLFENILNLKLIHQQADKMEKSVEFSTTDEFGTVLLDILAGKDVERIPEDFGESPKRGMPSLPRINLPHLNIKLPALGGAKKGALIFILILISLVGAFIYYGSTAPKAKAVITVGARPYTRSITIKVKSDASTDVGGMILKGTSLFTTVEETGEKDTTGTKTVGEAAKGEITFYNKTSSEIKLDKGDKITYKGKSTDLVYLLESDVKIPESAPQDPLDPASPLNPGEAKVKIEARDIGDIYNLEDGKSFEISGYKKGELEGKNKDKISGGSSKEIKVVTQEDMNNLSNELKTKVLQKAEESIKNKLGSSQKLIAGSTKTAVTSENFSAKVDDEKDKISLTQAATGEALVYSESDLNNFMDEYFKGVIPEGHYMPNTDKKVTVNVLGQSAGSVLNSTEADIQVTLSSIIIPDIKEDEVKKDLAGKTNQEARVVIDNLKNVDAYEFNISPVVPFFTKVPKNPDKIEVILNKEYKGEAL